MIKIHSEIIVQKTTGQEIYNFMLNCTDKKYQEWWPGTHMAFHTIKRYPHNIGNLVVFDEFIGKRRLNFKGVVISNNPGKEIVWQMKKLFKIPAWLNLKFEDIEEGLKITHTMKAGFDGVGKFFDPLLRLYLTAEFEKELDAHAHFEFHKLSEILAREDLLRNRTLNA